MAKGIAKTPAHGKNHHVKNPPERNRVRRTDSHGAPVVQFRRSARTEG